VLVSNVARRGIKAIWTRGILADSDVIVKANHARVHPRAVIRSRAARMAHVAAPWSASPRLCARPDRGRIRGEDPIRGSPPLDCSAAGPPAAHHIDCLSLRRKARLVVAGFETAEEMIESLDADVATVRYHGYAVCDGM
jgi:hypothetical protein